MIDSKTLALFKERYKSFSVGGGSDSALPAGLTIGMVVSTDDPLEMGRLQVFCPALNDNPKKILHLPWCTYISPFAGSINNSSYTRGTGDGTATSEGAIHYGFWAIPELGAHVLVGCIDNDFRRRFWIGSVPEHQETHTLFSGRFNWDGKDGTPDGPLTSSNKPIQPIYDNWTRAFVDRESREWKSRGADYQATANTKAGNGAPSKIRGEDYLDDTYEGISSQEKDAWVAEQLGSHGYDWSGFKSAGGFKSSRVFGFSTPGFHSLSMDDRPFNLRTKLRSATGHMILMDDTNERIYIMTNKGNNYVEMDSNGNIDVFSERRVSISAAKDVNISAGGTFRVHAEHGIHMYAGHNDAETVRQSLAEPPMMGEIRLQTEADLHVIANNIRNKSHENTYNEVGLSLYEIIGDSTFRDVQNEINVRTLTGDHVISVAGNLFETVQKSSKRLSYGTSALTSQGDLEVYSFDGGLSAGSKNDASFKSAAGNVDLEAMGQTSDAGNVRINSPRSQITVGDDGISGLTSKTAGFKAAESIDLEISPEKTGSKTGGAKTAPLNFEGVPEPSACNITTLPPVTWTPGATLSDAELAAVCYNAGFRGQDLVIATALIRGESSGNPAAVNGTASDGKWGPAVGLFQIRTLNNPKQYSGTVDELRDNTARRLEDPNVNAKVAYQIFEKCSPPGRWSVGKWESFQSDRIDQNFSQYVADAAAAVEELCGGNVSGVSVTAADIVVTEDTSYVDECGHDHEHEEVMFGAVSPSLGSSFSMTTAGVTIQSITDLDIKTLSNGGFSAFSDVVETLNETLVKTNMLMYFSSILVPAISSLASAVGESFSVPFSFSAGSLVSSIYDGAMPSALREVAGGIGELNDQITALGGLGLDMPLEMYNIVGQLQGNVSALSALGLPTDLSFPVDPSTFTGVNITDQLTKAVESVDIPLLEIPTFRRIADKIFQNNAYPVGSISLGSVDLSDIGLE